MTTIAVINQKGGTGKTTTAVNLSAGLARKGLHVLLIDLDPQAHATYGLGVDLDDNAEVPTIADVFNENRVKLSAIILDTHEPNLKLAPSDIRLARAASFMHTQNFRELMLSKAIESVEGFDYVILDCQPSLDVLSINALVAARRILIPTQAAGHALRGLADLLVTIQSIKSESSEWKILLTMLTGFGEERQQQAVRILAPLEDHILKTRIRRTESIERSQMESEDEQLLPVVLQKSWNRGAQDYRSLVKEILELWPA